MHHYRQALLRMRQGDSDRDIAAARLMGRRKAGDWRALAKARGWLDPQTPLPDDQAVADALAPPKRANSTVSSLEAHRTKVLSWLEQGVPGTAIHQALVRQHGFGGSYIAPWPMAQPTTAPSRPSCITGSGSHATQSGSEVQTSPDFSHVGLLPSQTKSNGAVQGGRNSSCVGKTAILSI